MPTFLQHLPSTTEILGLAAGVFVVTLAYAGARMLLSKTERASQFYRQWTLIALVLTGGVLLVLLLPVGGELKGQLVSLIGVLLSGAIALSSTTFLGNAMAGIMLRSLRNFRPGDFIHVGEHFGRVTVRGVLHTEIQTADRDLLTLPNLMLVTQAVQVVRASGTVVSAKVSLGYDVPRKDVESALLEASRRAGLEEPFVQVLDLGDYSVLYRAAGLCSNVRSLLSVRSELRRHVLDACHEAGIEIVSPMFINERRLGSTAPPIVPPDALEPAAPTQAQAPTATIFDKAEMASALASRVAEQTKLVERQKELEAAAAKAKGEEREALNEELEALGPKLEHVTRRIELLKERSSESEEPAL